MARRSAPGETFADQQRKLRREVGNTSKPQHPPTDISKLDAKSVILELFILKLGRTPYLGSRLKYTLTGLSSLSLNSLTFSDRHSKLDAKSVILGLFNLKLGRTPGYGSRLKYTLTGLTVTSETATALPVAFAPHRSWFVAPPYRYR
jgi:hypothetical protein